MKKFEDYESVSNDEALKSGVPMDEQETVINYGHNDGLVDVWTSDTLVMAKLDKLCKEVPENYKCIEVSKLMLSGKLANKRYKIRDKGLIALRQRRLKREYTEEQRKEMQERMARVNAQKNAELTM